MLTSPFLFLFICYLFVYLIGIKGSLDTLEKRFLSDSTLFVPPSPPPQSAREQVAHTLHKKVS